MGNRRRAYKPNSKTRQKRAVQRRDWELEEMEDDVSRHAAVEPDASAAPPAWRRLISFEKRPSTTAEKDSTPWSVRGLATMSLIAAVLCVPLGLVAWFADHRQYSLGAYVSRLYDPVVGLIPFYLVLTMLLAMPLARALAGEPRTLRILETLGYAAVIQILLILTWTFVYRANSYYFDNPQGVVGAAVADVVALSIAPFAYGPVSRWLVRRRPRPR